MIRSPSACGRMARRDVLVMLADRVASEDRCALDSVKVEQGLVQAASLDLEKGPDQFRGAGGSRAGGPGSRRWHQWYDFGPDLDDAALAAGNSKLTASLRQ